MSDIKLKAANGGGSISLKGPSTLGSDRDLVDTSGHINLLDSQKLNVGTGNDLTIEHTGSASKIINNTGYLNIRSDSFWVGNNAESEAYISAVADGAVTLSYNGADTCSTSANGLAFPSGKGIDFSATSDGNGTDSSELLDDYEEGTFSPTSHGWSAGGSTTYTSQKGTYVKVGRMVTAIGSVAWSAISGASGVHAIGGLPYSTNSSFDWEGTCFVHTINMGDGKVSGKIGDGYSSSFLLYISNAGSEGYVSADTNGGEAWFTVTYITS